MNTAVSRNCLARLGLLALACVALSAWSPTMVLAQPSSEDTAIDDADDADEAMPAAPKATTGTEPADDQVTQEELDDASAAIAEAEKQLEDAKRQMELMGRKMAPAPTPAPGTGTGLVAVDGRAKKLQVSLNEDGTLYFRIAMWLQVWTRAMQLNPGTTVLGETGATSG